MILLILLALLLLPLGLVVVRRGELRRLALRNINRRRGEALLVVVGSMLGTAIITSSFVVGDTLNASIRDIARTTLGPADIGVRTTGLGELDAVEAAIATNPIPGTDGTLRIVRLPAPVATPPDAEGERAVAPDAALLEVDFDAASRFGPAPAATGFAGAGSTPVGDEAVLVERLADRLGVEPGAVIEIYAYGQQRTVRVREVIDQVGVAGFGSDGLGLFVAPGTIAELAAGGAAGVDGEGGVPPGGWVLVSIEGGVFESADRTPQVAPLLEERVAGLQGVEVVRLKANLLEEAEAVGASFTELFSAIGGFSVIAGILLLVNIFVMLGEERKVELGMLRAVGLRRADLVQGFALEGAGYAAVASAVGAVLGIGIGRVIVTVTEGLFNQGDVGFGEALVFRFTADPRSILTGLAIGLVISLVTVWATSWRISRLNIISAIRDLPDPSAARRHIRGAILGALGVIAGGLLLAAGLGGNRMAALAGVPIAAFSGIPLLDRLVARRMAVTILGAIALVWGVGVFSLLPEIMGGADIFLFVVQGVVLVAAAVAVVTVNDEAFGQIAERLSLSGRGLSLRLGLAYPLARRFRTALLLGMYALVIFTLTFLAVFNQLFGEQAPRFTEEVRAGHDVLVQSNPGNPPTAAELLAHPEVESVAPLLRGFPQFTAAYQPEPMYWAVTGFDERLLEHGAPVLATRMPAYATDQEAFRAVLNAPDLAIASEFFLQQGGGPPTDRLRAGEQFTIINPATGEERTLTVAGSLSADWMFTGPMLGAEGLRSIMGEQVSPTRHYVRLAPGADADHAAELLTGRLLANGSDARTFERIIRANLSQQEGFIRLMEGFLGLGLLIGIAGLGVVMVRAVRERRRQIGMLRAMGFPARVVRAAFLVEAAFVALQGIVIGVALGMVTSYQLLTNSNTFGDSGLGFVVPWAALAFVLGVPLVASLLAAAWPASQAARIRPAVALRIAD